MNLELEGSTLETTGKAVSQTIQFLIISCAKKASAQEGGYLAE
ncbi:MAG: hypothetical protein R2824_35835 [Saprospiraceae bacterium]